MIPISSTFVKFWIKSFTLFIRAENLNTISFANGFAVYPNPFTNGITIKLNAIIESEVKITLTDVLGREILTTKIENNSTAKTIPTSQLAQGVYWIKLENGKNSFVTKLVKE